MYVEFLSQNMSFWFSEEDIADCFTLIVLLSVFCISACRSRRIGMLSAIEVSPGHTCYLMSTFFVKCNWAYWKQEVIIQKYPLSQI